MSLSRCIVAEGAEVNRYESGDGAFQIMELNLTRGELKMLPNFWG